MYTWCMIEPGDEDVGWVEEYDDKKEAGGPLHDPVLQHVVLVYQYSICNVMVSLMDIEALLYRKVLALLEC